MLSKLAFKRVKNIIPRISDTELIALRSGTTSIDRDIFKGRVNLPINIDYKQKWESHVYNYEVDKLLEKYGNIDKIYPGEYSKEIVNYLGEKYFLSFLIKPEYGGNKMSVQSLSRTLIKITSKNPSLGILTMVPNSLGPSELLQEYGTDEQKNQYLPGLATGAYIPCFGLTGPNNGSDATGTIDKGTVVLDDNGNKMINVTINKRYITLAPVSNLIGLAFNLEDPDNLLDTNMTGVQKPKPGVSVALIKDTHHGLIKETHHDPLGVGFPNGTLKGNLTIDMKDLIGGEAQTGNGWKMLMECLAAGRGICLPATAAAGSKTALWGTFNYALHREQFRMPIIKMQAIEDKIVDMLFHTWLIQSGVELTNLLLDSGEKPAVISAIMKQQTTDRAQIVINHGMDILGGSAICKGDNNFLEKFYRSSPIGITVEGSNTLTRNLIIFGQGINKSHPHISNILETVNNNDVKAFGKEFSNMIKHFVKTNVYSMLHRIFIRANFNNYKIERQVLIFANLANYVALLGGKVKSEQTLSADMADILSNLYLAKAVLWYNENEQISDKLTDYCINRIYYENAVIIKRVIDNYPGPLRFLLYPYRSKIKSNKYSDNREIMKEFKTNKILQSKIREHIYIDGVLADLENLNNLKKGTDEYNALYQKVISVGEYPNE